MNQFNDINDAALDQVTGGGVLGDLLAAPIEKADEVIDTVSGILGDAKDFLKGAFGQLGGLLGLN